MKKQQHSISCWMNQPHFLQFKLVLVQIRNLFQVNSGSGFVEVSVGKIPDDMNENGHNEFPSDMFQVIVPQTQLMTQTHVKTGKRDGYRKLGT